MKHVNSVFPNRRLVLGKQWWIARSRVNIFKFYFKFEDSVLAPDFHPRYWLIKASGWILRSE